MNEPPLPYPEFPKHLEYIEDVHVKEAFAWIVSQSANLPGYTARPNPHGYITRNLHYYADANDRSKFAFNITQRWLLFYLQRPAETHPGLSLNVLKENFKDAAKTKNGEFNFRIRILAEAKDAMRIVFDVAVVVDTCSFPDEVQGELQYLEGARITVFVNGFERNPRAREACIRHYGHRCAVCNFSFRETYGPLGEDFIHVHHLVELASIRTEYDTLNAQS
jgi:hypothetical protein